MRFKNAEENGVQVCYMSPQETEKYGLREMNVIENPHMPYKVEDGRYTLKVNGVKVEAYVATLRASDGYIGSVIANGVKFSVVKLRPLRRHDVLRGILKHFNEISNSGEKMSERRVIFAG